MRAQTTTDPDCARGLPWAGLTRAEERVWIDRAGGVQAATNFILSFGRSPRYQSNRDFRETHTQGPSLDLVTVDAMEIETIFQTDKVYPGGPARALDCDEWNAIHVLAPSDLPDHDVLTLSAKYGRGESVKIGKEVGLSGRRVRQIQDWQSEWADTHLTRADRDAHLDDPLPTEEVKRRPLSRAGRKPKRLATPILMLAPRVPLPPKAPRRVASRRPRRRFVDPRQCDFGWGIAA